MAEKLIFQLEIDGGKSVTTLSQLKEELKRLKTEFSEAKFGTPEFTQLGQTIKRVEQESKNLTNSFKEQNNIVPGTVGAIKQEIKQLNIDLNNSVVGSEEFNRVLLEIGRRKNSLKDITDNVKSLGGLDTILKQFAAGGQAVAGAFGIATSASALFGEENEDLQKSILKVQAAMSLLQSIESLAGSKDAANIIRRIFLFTGYKKSIDDSTNATIKNTQATTAGAGATNVATTASKGFVGGLKAIKAGLIATGIGLFVVLISELINRWSEVKSAIEKVFPIFKGLGNIVDETKQRFVGAFYAIINAVQPVGKFIIDALVTPWKFVFDAVKIAANVLKNPFDLSNIEKGISDFGNLFVGVKDKLVGDIQNIKKAFNEGFDNGVNLQKGRQAAAALKEQIENEIKTLEQSVQRIKSGSIERLNVEQDIINKKLSITEKGSDDYEQLLTDKFIKQEEIKDFNLQQAKTNAEKREKEFADHEAKIKEQFANQEQVINITAQVQVNEGANPIEVESIRDIEITQNKLAELNARKEHYVNYQKDVTIILSEIQSEELKLIVQNKELITNLTNIEFNQDNSNLDKYVKEQENIINQSYLNNITALQDKNLTTEQLESESKRLSEQREKELSELKRKELELRLQYTKDYGKDSTALSEQLTLDEITNAQNSINKRIEQEKAFADAKLELTKQLHAQQLQLEQQAIDTLFQIINSAAEQEKQIKLDAVQSRLNDEQNAIDLQVERGLLTQEQGEARKKTITEKAEKDKRKIVREATIVERVSAVAKIGIDLGRAIAAIQLQASILAANPLTLPLVPLALAQIPISIASAGLNTAAVLAVPLPPLAKGGVIKDKNQNKISAKDYLLNSSTVNSTIDNVSNSTISKNSKSIEQLFYDGGLIKYFVQGGVPNSQTQPVINVGGKSIDDVLAINDKGVPVARVNSGEGIVSVPAMKKFGSIISELNFAAGGAKFPGFNMGGVIPINNNNTTTTTNSVLFDNSELIAELKELRKDVQKPSRSYVVESDITNSQRKISTIENRASF